MDVGMDGEIEMMEMTKIINGCWDGWRDWDNGDDKNNKMDIGMDEEIKTMVDNKNNKMDIGMDGEIETLETTKTIKCTLGWMERLRWGGWQK